ncbi:hypothetical protein BRADI_1g17445v3 [Brachypodium distachyon]|uniref:Uncharacterized protein n=1 Tax=Brachypodium distachyon TaxID=15368 RepID=A0A2K2DJU5_BRADI|nr:hypothetical protein BRADI_1g17445v3 [Brachypodium distachyon]
MTRGLWASFDRDVRACMRASSLDGLGPRDANSSCLVQCEIFFFLRGNIAFFFEGRGEILQGEMRRVGPVPNVVGLTPRPAVGSTGPFARVTQHKHGPESPPGWALESLLC